jgi:hypothetical protein
MARKIDVYRRRSDGAYSLEKGELENSWAPYFLRLHGRKRGIFSLRHSPIGIREQPVVVDNWDGYVASVAAPEPLRLADATIPVFSRAGRRFVITDLGSSFPHTYEPWSESDIETDMSLLEAIRDQTAKARASEKALGTNISFLTNWVAMGGIGLLVLVFIGIVLTVFVSQRAGS